MKVQFEGKFSEVSKFFDEAKKIYSPEKTDGNVHITIEEFNDNTIELNLTYHFSEVKKKVARKTTSEKKSTGGSAFWSKFTPEERSKEMKRRQKVAKNKKLKAKKEPKKKISVKKLGALEKAREALREKVALQKQQTEVEKAQLIDQKAEEILSRVSA
jgi:hypothetical protein